MNSQELEQEHSPQVTQPHFYTMEERVESSLLLLLQRLPDYFQGRAKQSDAETLVFCLQHLFDCVDTLYQHTLPALLQQGTQHQSAYMLAYRYGLWEQLQAVQLTLERIESHCHLLLSATSSLLPTLDTTEDVSCTVQEQTYVGSEHWQRAYEMLSQALHGWQEQQSARSTFAEVFASTSQSHLAQIDTALAMLFDGANAIFGDIVPDIQLVAQGDDEIAATLLFDLMQQNDLLLIQINKLVDPLHNLIKYYSVKE